MKIINEVAIWFVIATIIIDYYNNTLTAGHLIIRILLIVINAVCCVALDER